MPRKRKAEIGDICEIVSPAGRAYVQYTHDGHGMGELVRVLPGLYDVRPKDLAPLAKQKELYFVFCTLDYAVRDKNAEIVSHQPVPDWARPYPLMRWGLAASNSSGIFSTSPKGRAPRERQDGCGSVGSQSSYEKV